MPAESGKESPHEALQCCWPVEFTKRREFDRQAENQAYIDFLKVDFDDGEEAEDEGHLPSDEEEEEEDNDSGGEDSAFESEDEAENDDPEACNRYSNVRLFMQGTARDREKSGPLDQFTTVAEFCKLASLNLKTKPGQNMKPIALLDDRNMGGSVVDGNKGNCRPYPGPLTTERLRQELSRKRFKVESARNTLENISEYEEIDAERRVIFVTDLDPSSIEALAVTASRSQAPALKDLVYRHLKGKTFIGVTIPSQGFRVFTLAFHIPYFVLKRSDTPLQDPRIRSDGKPLRQCWHLPLFGSKSVSSSRAEYFLYEAQVSVAVTGFDDSVWTAYGIVDTYFGTKESIRRYDRFTTGHSSGRPDPLAAGQINADVPIWNPREYFLRVFEIRIIQISREWDFILDRVEDAVKQSRANHVFPLSSNDPKVRQEVRSFSVWNSQIVALLRQLIGGLADTVAAWDTFQQTEIGYFLYDDGFASLKPSILVVSKTFAQLKTVQRNLERLKKELCEDNPQGAHAHLSLENNDATILQRRTASHVEILTAITIIFYPLALSASLFSTQGVLPFTPSLAYFMLVLVILGVLLVATVIICSHWASWMRWMVKSLQVTFEMQRQAWKRDEQQIGGEISGTSASWSLEHRFLPHRVEKANVRSWRELEEGTELETMEHLMGNLRVGNTVESSTLNGLNRLSKCEQNLSSKFKTGNLYDNSMAVVKSYTSTAVTESPDCSGRQFRLSEMHEDLLHPARFKTKLTGLQAYVCRESAIAQQSLKIGSQDTKTSLTPAFLLQECQKILKCILRNVAVLRDAGFCFSTATFLRIDPNRTQVAFLESVELDKVVQLGTLIDVTETSLENLRRLDSTCTDLLGDHFVSSSQPIAGNIAIMSLRILDFALVSHVCSHMGDMGRLMSKDTSIGRKFHISSQASSIIDSSVPLETGTVSFSRRTLKCLNGFLCGEQVWVLHGANTDHLTDSTELFLSTTPDTFADVWGPMWKITSAGKPLEVLRYDLEHGSVVPFSLISGNCGHFVRTESEEELCHWIPNSELEKLKGALATTSPPQIGHPRLLIGACRHSVIPNNEECYCNLTDVYNEFVSKRYLREIGSSPRRLETESMTVGTAAGGAGLGAPTIQYSQTMKICGTPRKEAFHKRWKNSPPRLRPWRYLLRRYGLQVSICTRNSRRVRLVDLICGDTMIDFMRTNPSYASEPWREAFEEMCHTDPAQLVTFQADNPTEREGFEQYITDCLDVLIPTGIGSRAHGPFVALWVYNGQPWEVAFPRQYHEWTGLVEDSDSICSFVVLERCLVNTLGRKCCNSQEYLSENVERIQMNKPAVLETFLTISDRERPDGLCLRPTSDGKRHWSVGGLWNRRHCIKLGKRGKLEGQGFWSSKSHRKSRNSHPRRVLTGKWSPEGTFEAATNRVFSVFIAAPETHTEHICDGPDNELSPLPYLVLDHG